MIEMSAKVCNAQGIHCRPSVEIVKAVQGYAGHVSVLHDSDACDPLSVMGLLQLELCEGDEVRVCVEGDDEEAVCRRLVGLFEKPFNFTPRE